MIPFKEIIKEKILELKDKREEERMEEAEKRIRIYKDDYEEYVLEELEKQFVKENFERMRFFVDTSTNVLKRVVKDVAKAYIPPPQREWIGLGETQLERWNKKMREIYERAKVNRKLKTANRLLLVVNDVMLKVTWRNGGIELDIITPNISFVLQNEEDPTKAEAVIYWVEYLDDRFRLDKRWIYWDKDYHFVLDEDLNLIEMEDNPEGINPYGELPFVFIHLDDEVGKFWNETTGQDLVNLTIGVGVRKTLKNYMFKQMLKQLAVMSDDFENAKKMLHEQIMDPASPLLIPGEAKILDFQIDLEKLQKDINQDIESVISGYGLSLNQWLLREKGEMSGRALRIKNSKLKELRDEQIEIFREIEKELFEKIRLVWNYHVKEKIPKELEIRVDFAEMKVEPDPKEMREEIDWKLKKGLISPAQVYMKFNPDVKTEEEAEKRVRENLEKLAEWETFGWGAGGVFEEKGEE